MDGGAGRGVDGACHASPQCAGWRRAGVAETGSDPCVGYGRREHAEWQSGNAQSATLGLEQHLQPPGVVHAGFGNSGTASMGQTLSCSFLQSSHGPSFEHRTVTPATTPLFLHDSRLRCSATYAMRVWTGFISLVKRGRRVIPSRAIAACIRASSTSAAE